MNQAKQFTAISRLLHWVMAILVISTLYIGINMVASLAYYHQLLAIHRPLGILILILVVIRLINRILSPAPDLPGHMPTWQKWAAKGSHILLYLLLFAMPLVGWAMLSAAPYPIVLCGSWHLPPILPANAALYSYLRTTHTVLAAVLFFTIVIHIGAAFMHALIYRDGVFQSMASIKRRPN